MGFPVGSVQKNPPASAGDAGLITRSGRSRGAGSGTNSCILALKNPMDREAWWATVHEASKNWTQQSTHTHAYMFYLFHSLLLKCSIFVPPLQCSRSTEYALFRDIHRYKIAYLHNLFKITLFMNFKAEIIWGWSPHSDLVQISPTVKTRVKWWLPANVKNLL